jgi:hypothetical protein
VRLTPAIRANLAFDDTFYDTVIDPRKYLAPARAAVTEAVATMIAAID